VSSIEPSSFLVSSQARVAAFMAISRFGSATPPFGSTMSQASLFIDIASSDLFLRISSAIGHASAGRLAGPAKICTAFMRIASLGVFSSAALIASTAGAQSPVCCAVRTTIDSARCARRAVRTFSNSAAAFAMSYSPFTICSRGLSMVIG
jgi:hypothetical protein